MATKNEFMKALDELPENATIDDAVERLVFMLAVEHGLAQADAGELIPHEEIVELVSRTRASEYDRRTRDWADQH
jgi:predicted transcriptional regulator